jgi:glycosyltransferase involved in cell wall biosynthesis
MLEPAVSVLIPCHNAGAFLKETLDSVMVQDGVRWEVILVEDGSTDDSLDIAEGYGEQIRIVATPQRGAGAARELAAAESKGRYLQYLDADDVLLPGALCQRVAALDASKAGVVVSGWQRILPAEDGSWREGAVEIRRHSEWHPCLDLAVFKGFWAPPAALMYRAEIAKRVTWSRKLPIIQDARFLLDVALLGTEVTYAARVTARYRQHTQGSLSSGGRLGFWQDVYRNTREIEEIWSNAGLMDSERLSALADGYANLARHSFLLDESFYRECLTDHLRYPEVKSSRFLRAARLLDRGLGYGPACSVLGWLRGLF